MQLNADTRLKDLADEYPWLIDKVASMDERLKIAKTFVGRQLIKRSTIADASRLSGYSVDQILQQLEKMLQEHETV